MNRLSENMPVFLIPRDRLVKNYDRFIGIK